MAELSTSSYTSTRRAPSASLLDDWLTILGVRHTRNYTVGREKDMAFKTWFGLARVLEEYGVTSAAYHLDDKQRIATIPTPFIVHTSGESGNIIVTSIAGDKVEYLSLGQKETTDLTRLIEASDGNIFISRPGSDEREPDYTLHARLDFLNGAKRGVMGCGMAILLVYAFIANGLYTNVAAYFIALLDIAGLYVTYLLVQKSLKIHNPKADRFCGVLQAGGCDDILATPAAKFFGLFGWSEVGFAYFAVSLLTLLAFPAALPALAICNICCLPFSVWSIWYQRFRAHRWCTLCVTVQSLLWLLFIAYLSGGEVAAGFHHITDGSLIIHIVMLGIAYLSAMLGLNAIMPLISNDKSTN